MKAIKVKHTATGKLKSVEIDVSKASDALIDAIDVAIAEEILQEIKEGKMKIVSGEDVLNRLRKKHRVRK